MIYSRRRKHEGFALGALAVLPPPRPLGQPRKLFFLLLLLLFFLAAPADASSDSAAPAPAAAAAARSAPVAAPMAIPFVAPSAVREAGPVAAPVAARVAALAAAVPAAVPAAAADAQSRAARGAAAGAGAAAAAAETAAGARAGAAGDAARRLTRNHFEPPKFENVFDAHPAALRPGTRRASVHAGGLEPLKNEANWPVIIKRAPRPPRARSQPPAQPEEAAAAARAPAKAAGQRFHEYLEPPLVDNPARSVADDYQGMSRTADPSAAKQEARDEDVTAARFREERRSRKASDDVASDAPTTASPTTTDAAAAASSSATPPTTLVPRFKADVTIFASSPLPTSSETRRPSGISSAGEEQEGAKDAGPPRSPAFVNERTPVLKEKVPDSESSRVAKGPEFQTDVAKSSETGADAISKALKNSGERDKDGDSHVQRVRLKGPSGPIQLSIDPEKGTITVGASRLGMNCGAAENSAKDAPVQLSMSISGDKAGTIEASIPKSAMSLTVPRTLGAPKPQKVGSVDAEAAKALRGQLHVKRSDGSDGAVGIKFGRTQSNALEDRRKDVGGLGVDKNLQEATGIFKQSLQRGKPASDASSDYSVIDYSARSDDRDLKNSKKDAVNINSMVDGSHEGISNDVMNIQIGVSPARRKSVQTTNDVTGSWKLLGESVPNLASERDSILSTLLPNMPEQSSSNMDLEVMNNGAIGSDTSINDASARRVIDRSSTEQWANRIVSSVMASGAPSNDMLEGKSLFVPVIGGRNIAPNEAFAFVDEKAAEDNEVQTIPTARAYGMNEVSETGRERLHTSSTGEPPDSLANTNTKITSVAPTERIKIRREDSSGQPRATEKSGVDISEASGNEKAGSPAEEGSVTLGGAGSALNVHMGDSPDPSQQLSLRQKAHQLLGHIFPQGGGDDDDDAADEDAGGGEDASGTGSGGGDAVSGPQQLPARKEGGVGGGDVVAASGELHKQLVKPGQRLPISETCNDEDTKMTRERKRVYYHHQEISNAAKEARRRRPIAKRADGTEDADAPGSRDGGEIVPAARIEGATGFKPGARMKYIAETRSETDTGDASGSEMSSLTGNGISSSDGTGAESRSDSGSASEGEAEPRAESSASEGTASLVESEDSDAGSAPPRQAAATRHRKQPRRDDLRDSVRDNPLDMVEARAEQRVLPRAVGEDAGEGERARGMQDFTGANNLAEHVYPAVGDVDTSVFSREAGGADARPARGGGWGPLGGDFPAENSASGEVNPGSGVEALKSGAVAEIQENSLVQDPLAGADVLHFRAVSAAQWPLPSLPPPPPPSPPEQSAQARPPAPQPLKQLFSVVTLEPPADEGLSDTDQAQAQTQAQAQAQAPAAQQGRAPQGSESGAVTPTRSPPPPPPPPPPAAPMTHKGPAASPPQRPQSAKKWRRPPGGARPSHSSPPPPPPQTSSPPPPPPPPRPIPTVSKPAAGSTTHAAAAAAAAKTRPPAQATSTAAAATHPSGRLAVIASSTARPAPAPAALKSSAGGGDAAAGEPCGGRASSPGFRSGPPAAGAARAAGVLRPTGTRGGDDDRKGSRHRARMPGRRGGGHLGRSAGEAEAVVGGAPAATLAQLDAQPQAQPPPQGPGGSGGEGESEGDGRWRHLNELLRNELWTGDLDGAPHNVRLMKIGRAKSDAGAVTSSSASKPPDAKFRTPPNILNALQAMGATASAAAEIAAANQDADAGDESPPPPPSTSTTSATDALEDVMDRLIEDVADQLVASTNRHASEATCSTRAPAPGVWGAGAGAGAAAGGGGEDWNTAPAAAAEPDEAAEAGDVNGLRGAGGAAARAPGGGLGVGVGADVGSRPGGVESSASAGGAESPGGAANEEPEDSEASAADGGESGFEAPAQSSPASPLRAPRPLRRKHHPRAGDGAAGAVGAPRRARAAGAGELATVAGAGKDAGLAEGRRAAKREEPELEQNTPSASDQPEDSGLARLESLAAADALPATALPGGGAGARLQEMRDNERRPQGGGGFSGRRVYRRLATGTPERVAPYPAAGAGRGVANGADSHANDDLRRLKGGDAPTAKRSLASSGVAHGWARDAARGDEGEGEASETVEREAGGGGGGGGGEEERLHRGGGLTAERSLSERMGHGCHGWHGRRHTLPSRCPPCPSAAPAAPTTPAASAPSTCACCPGGCPAHSTAYAPAQPRTGTRCSNHPAPSSSLGPAHTPSPRSHPPQT